MGPPLPKDGLPARARSPRPVFGWVLVPGVFPPHQNQLHRGAAVLGRLGPECGGGPDGTPITTNRRRPTPFMGLPPPDALRPQADRQGSTPSPGKEGTRSAQATPQNPKGRRTPLCRRMLMILPRPNTFAKMVQEGTHLRFGNAKFFLPKGPPEVRKRRRSPGPGPSTMHRGGRRSPLRSPGMVKPGAFSRPITTGSSISPGEKEASVFLWVSHLPGGAPARAPGAGRFTTGPQDGRGVPQEAVCSPATTSQDDDAAAMGVFWPLGQRSPKTHDAARPTPGGGKGPAAPGDASTKNPGAPAQPLFPPLDEPGSPPSRNPPQKRRGTGVPLHRGPPLT